MFVRSKLYLAAALSSVVLLGFIWADPIGSWLKERLSRAWPLTQGRFENGRVLEFTGRARAHVLEVTYSYLVEGDTYFCIYRKSFDNESDAKQLLANLERSPFRIRFDPRDNRRSVLDPYKDF